LEIEKDGEGDVLKNQFLFNPFKNRKIFIFK